MKKYPLLTLCLALGLYSAIALNAQAYHLSIQETHGEPNETVLVPIMIDDVSGLASVHVKLNYDPIMLEYLGVETNNSIAAAYTIVDEAIDGSVDIIMVRENGLANGNGVLVFARMLVRPGNVPGTGSDLVIARRDLGGDFGGDLSWSAQITHENADFFVAFSKTQDRDNDGRTDYEEQISDGSGDYNPYHPTTNPTGTDSNADLADSDNDGMTDGAEAIAGTNYADPENVFALSLQPNMVVYEPGTGFIIRWQGSPGRVYDVQRSNDPSQPFLTLPGAANIPAHPVMNEHIDPIQQLDQNYYYRIGVRKP